jgi:hypothetical protein
MCVCCVVNFANATIKGQQHDKPMIPAIQQQQTIPVYEHPKSSLARFAGKK